MSETGLSYVSKSILNVVPDCIDLSKEIKYSSYVTRREFVEIYPTTQPPNPVQAGNIGTSCRILLSDPSRWMDKRSATLQMDIGGIAPANASDVGNFAVLDGPCSMLSRVNIYVGGQQINGGTVNNLNKIACALQMNKGSVASYLSDETALMGGCERLKYVLSNGAVPATFPFYTTIVDSPYNLLPSAVVAPAGNTLTDAQGFRTSKGSYRPGVSALGV